MCAPSGTLLFVYASRVATFTNESPAITADLFTFVFFQFSNVDTALFIIHLLARPPPLLSPSLIEVLKFAILTSHQNTHFKIIFATFFLKVIGYLLLRKILIALSELLKKRIDKLTQLCVMFVMGRMVSF